MKDLQKTMNYIDKRYVFNAETYPDLELTTRDEKFDFGVRHSVLHMQKSLGKIAEYSEGRDHGELGSKKEVKIATVKMLINILKLASIQGMNADDLLKLVPKVMV